MANSAASDFSSRHQGTREPQANFKFFSASPESDSGWRQSVAPPTRLSLPLSAYSFCGRVGGTVSHHCSGRQLQVHGQESFGITFGEVVGLVSAGVQHRVWPDRCPANNTGWALNDSTCNLPILEF